MSPLRRLAWAGVCGVSTILAVAPISTAAAAQSGGKNTSPAESAAPESKPLGFAIESEMFTYSAMDSEGAAVACNVAQKLGATDPKCAPKGTMNNSPGVVIIGSDSNTLSDFQLWRSDISTMDILTQRANRYCPQQSQRGIVSSVEKMLSSTPEGEFISIAKALLTTTTVKTPVEGNILDQTLMNDIAGHLRGLGVSVVIPDTYAPHSLVTINEARSPYLATFLAMLTARGCLTEKAAGEAAQPTNGDQAEAARDKQLIAQAIDGFLDSLAKPDVSAAPKPVQPGVPPVPEAPTISHLNAVMRADGLAQEMGFAPSNSNAGDNSPWDVLWMKALESGGDVVASDNLIKGSKTTYTGGAVGTYALFHLNGELECSGVFFNLAPPMQYGDISKLLDGSATVPPGRLVGGCSPTSK